MTADTTLAREQTVLDAPLRWHSASTPVAQLSGRRLWLDRLHSQRIASTPYPAFRHCSDPAGSGRAGQTLAVRGVGPSDCQKVSAPAVELAPAGSTSLGRADQNRTAAH